MIYLILKLVHVISVILFLGNIITGLYWAWHSHKSRDFQNISATFTGIIHSDKYFTIPGILGIVAAGIAAAVAGRIPLLSTGWIFWSIILFTISGILFGLFVAPLQRRLAAFTSENHLNPESWNSYCIMYKKWVIWGTFATITPLAAVVLMVLKPLLPGI